MSEIIADNDVMCSFTPSCYLLGYSFKGVDNIMIVCLPCR